LLALLWVGLAVFTLTAPDAAAGLHFDRLQRGWAVLVAASFGVVGIILPEKRFFTRSLAAITLALSLSAGVVILAGGRGEELVDAMTSELVARNQEFVRAYEQQLNDNASLRRVAEASPLFRSLAMSAPARMEAVAVKAATVFPALLALQSLAVLALAWALVHRLSRTRIGEPLTQLRRFRFDDKLVWGFLLGLALILPLGLQELNAIGWMFVVFFGGLYAVRGLGLVVWFAATRSRWIRLGLILLMVALPQYGLAVLLGLGVGDTWVDWRRLPLSPR
jgi:hypothetical protein